MSSQEKMFQLVEEYRNSGLSANAFARESNIPLSRFRYWIRKKKTLEKQDSGFVEIKRGRAATSMEVELLFPNGVQLRMNGADPALIAKLVQLRSV